MTDDYVAGFGFREQADFHSLKDAFDKAAGGKAITSLAAPADKCAHQGLRAFANALNLPLTKIDPDDLQTKVTPTRSEAVLAARGTGSVAEACALIAAGSQARLYRTREISNDRLAVCAIAKRR